MATKTVTPPRGRNKARSPHPSIGCGIPIEAPYRTQVMAFVRSPSANLDGDQYVRLLACVGLKDGFTTLDDISRALPSVARPLSAVFDLCDAGILAVDTEGAFGGDTRVWRIDD